MCRGYYIAERYNLFVLVGSLAWWITPSFSFTPRPRLPPQFHFNDAFVTRNRPQTNDYYVFCTTQGSGAEARHLKKTSTLGLATYKDLDDDAVLGIMGIVMQMGLTKLPRYSYHCSKDPDFNFIRIRDCMSRDLFTLTYARFLHFATPKDKLRHQLHELREDAGKKKGEECIDATKAWKVEMDALEKSIGDILHHVRC